MELNLQQQAVDITNSIMHKYYCERDIYAVLDYMAPEVSWIGPGEREKIYSLSEIQSYFEQARDSVPSCDISNVDLRAVDLGEESCLVVGSMMISTTPESELVLQVNQRVSISFKLINGAFKVVHLHFSNPYTDLKENEYFPTELGSQSYKYLKRLVQEKTEVIDMIAGNITGGLKGSNDDDTFSFFYVNEGLPRMLGYTYEEFMKKTGGTAVGTVYPPDLPAALADCVRCFEQGPVYSTEYRIEKKDKSLIWVLDSGRKALDSEGIMRINSIITDITPLKQALFELELERERYSIALENITGSMCEYDFEQDLFTIYRQKEKGKPAKKSEFANFSQQVRSGNPIHFDDGEAFFDLCCGRDTGAKEFRTCFFHPNRPWQWDLFSCSIIYDSTGTAVRSIGMLKDITNDKNQNLKLINQAQRDGLTNLLNQTAIKEAIQSYLKQGLYDEGKTNALLMIDIDKFKDINDTKGHLYGNEVLIKTARILENAAGFANIVGRIGGDEFIILIRESTIENIIKIAQEILSNVYFLGQCETFGISCSVGIACQQDKNETFTHFFERADMALYRAKDNGRNQWAMDEAPDNACEKPS